MNVNTNSYTVGFACAMVVIVAALLASMSIQLTPLQDRNIELEKLTAERLNGYAALFGCIALVGAYATTGQIIPGFV